MFNSLTTTSIKLIERRASKGWRGLLEQPRRLTGLLQKIPVVVFGKLRKGHCLGIFHMSQRIVRMYRRNGPLFTAKYLKQGAILVMWYVGGRAADRPALSMHMSLTRSGIPRFIPRQYRKMLRHGDLGVARVILTVCSLSRLMKVTTSGLLRVNPKTIHQIKWSPSEKCQEWSKKMQSTFFSVLDAYAPRYKEIPLDLGFSFEPFFSSTPNTYKDPFKESCVYDCLRGTKTGKRLLKRLAGRGKRLATSVYHALPVDATALLTLYKPEDLSRIGKMWYTPRTHWVVDGWDAPVEPVQDGKLGFGWLMDCLLSPARIMWWDFMKTRPEAGRFGFQVEGAGKVRVFAIANPILKRFLRPLHDWLMSVLRTIPTDGTFDQLRPVLRLKSRKMFSFDLKSATDLFPKYVTGCLLSSLFGDELAHEWYWLMANTAFRSPEKLRSRTKARVYKFTRGQPLGFYSSWPAFTLSHHAIVWYAAADVYPGKRFWDYAILGDDIVIADEKVANRYRQIMEEVKGVISLEKSLISDNGSCEFAKRFFVECHKERRDVSPVSLACILLCRGFVASFVFRTLGCTIMNSFRLRGGGYRVMSRVVVNDPKGTFARLSRRWKRHWLTLHGESGLLPLPLDMWLAFPSKGYLTPYEVGVARYSFLEALAPRDFDEESLEVYRFFWWGEQDSISERLLVSLVQSYCRYLGWYWALFQDPTRRLSDFLKPPISPRRLTREAEVRYNLTNATALSFAYGIGLEVCRFLWHWVFPEVFRWRSSTLGSLEVLCGCPSSGTSGFRLSAHRFLK